MEYLAILTTMFNILKYQGRKGKTWHVKEWVKMVNQYNKSVDQYSGNKIVLSFRFFLKSRNEKYSNNFPNPHSVLNSNSTHPCIKLFFSCS